MNDSTTYCIYRIVCFPTAKTYIGYTKTPGRRKTDHFRTLRDGVHYNVKLQRAFAKYGEGSFFFEVIEKGLTKLAALEREQFWITHYDSHHNGFNMTDGGEITGNSNKPCEWNGKQYPSAAAAALDVGINPNTMQGRIRNGYRCDADMVGTGAKSAERFSKPCEFDGVCYPSITAAAQALGISGRAMQNRLARGYTKSSDVPKGGKRGANKKACSWNGVDYPSKKAAAIALNVAYKSMVYWLKRGYTRDSDMKRKHGTNG